MSHRSCALERDPSLVDEVHRADDAIADDERDRRHPGETEPRERLPHVRLRPSVATDVRRRDELALLHREPGEAPLHRHPPRGAQHLVGEADGADEIEVLRLLVQREDHRGREVSEPRDGLDRASRNLIRIVRREHRIRNGVDRAERLRARLERRTRHPLQIIDVANAVASSAHRPRS
jgi:hypothetical protein